MFRRYRLKGSWLDFSLACGDGLVCLAAGNKYSSEASKEGMPFWNCNYYAMIDLLGAIEGLIRVFGVLLGLAHSPFSR
jgi:hypothetical protein